MTTEGKVADPEVLMETVEVIGPVDGTFVAFAQISRNATNPGSKDSVLFKTPFACKHDTHWARLLMNGELRTQSCDRLTVWASLYESSANARISPGKLSCQFVLMQHTYCRNQSTHLG